MNKDDFKFVIADVSSTGIGPRFTYAELLMHERVPFKFQSIIKIYILREMKILNPDIEEPENIEIGKHLLSLDNDNLIYDVYKRLKLRVRFCFPKKSGYGMKTLKIGDFISYVKKNGSDNIVLQEIILSNLGLMAFSV